MGKGRGKRVNWLFWKGEGERESGAPSPVSKFLECLEWCIFVMFRAVYGPVAFLKK